MMAPKIKAGLFAASLLALAGPFAPLIARDMPVAVSAPHQRVLPLQGGQNFRDLGGYRTADGRTTKWGLLFRSGSMHFLTPADYSYLQSRGIRTVCDFRSSDERSAEPADWPAAKRPNVLADDYAMDSMGIMPSPQQTPEQARAMMAATYPQIVSRFKGQYRRMFGELLAGRAPLAFNCSAGKDRTGVAAALLLTALGVPREAVIEDYLLTNRYFDPRKVVRSSAQLSSGWKSMPPGVLKAYMSADRSYIEAALRVLDQHKGGADGWLRDEMGLSRADLATLRNMYTERAARRA
ncbi:tyrosine-protein phosphatase [Sphingomonas jatrophae]|uniref:Protein-tyrosine phosphatase n=1 Tax=Sphingomonas jatrophae TaxID=1166337 RepID=A0A1I6M0U4_9SPHN|nr:tyrosine-protein phosphatase [Sphingomonas jatrophae]SFS09346.1 protein-tyrosine phosphatase [Sphingomonas jatrophae]